MKRFAVIGGGFAGLEAVRTLSSVHHDSEIVLIDKSRTSDFLPLLPDIVGSRIEAPAIMFSVSDFCKRSGITYKNDEVESIEVYSSRIVCRKSKISYDYLIVASGSETNFFGDNSMRNSNFKLDNSDDALGINERIMSGNFKTCIITGGGYTGIEIATHLKRRFGNTASAPEIVLVERSSGILKNTPEWMRKYASANLEKMGITVFTDTKLDGVDGSTAFLSNGKKFEGSICIWSAGVKADDFLRSIEEDIAPQGRLPVASDLCVKGNIFAAGDAAGFMSRGKPLRMGVQFSITQGRQAAKNVLSSSQGLATKSYRVLDPGFIVPMANGRSCGFVLNKKVRGRSASLLHYLLCIYRSQSFALKRQVLENLLKSI